MLGILMIIAILGIAGFFLWQEQQAKMAKEAQDHLKQQQEEEDKAKRKAIAEELRTTEERLEKLRAAKPMEFVIYGSRQFQEAPYGKGMFDTNLMQNGLPQRCVLVVKPSRMDNHGLATTTLKAAKLMRSQFAMTITAKTGITSQQTDFYDVYEAVEQEDLGRAEVRVLELKRELDSEH
jgi:alanyl-tRNA synthetase